MSSIATTNEISNVTFLPQTPTAQTSKEVIAENIKLLIEQLEAGHSEGLTAYLMAMGRFHNYSFGNILEIARQRPDATRVAGMCAWNQLGRKVTKGQKGIRILAPMIGNKRKKDKESEKPSPSRISPYWLAFAWCMSSMSADRRRRAATAFHQSERQCKESIAND